jgi:FixJ family two-component response regulator
MSSEQSSQFIAIVDDDTSVQTALQDLIESEGLSTLCFGSAEQFLDSGAHRKAACLIADIRMPGMSGHGDAKMRIQAMRDGAVEFLTKPFDNAVLVETVHAAVEAHAKALELRDSNR